MSLDPRLHAFRPDLADAHLKGQVEAALFVVGTPYRVVVGQAPLCRTPAGKLDSQLLFGESLRVFEVKHGWAWAQNDYDGYVGYVPLAAIREGTVHPTHQLCVPRSFRFSEADIKSPPLDHLSLATPLEGVIEGKFLALKDGGFVYHKHVEAFGTLHPDWVASAALLLNVPYLWGGRSALGIDCSGLVQTALRLAGRPARRDSYQQRDDERIGQELAPDAPLRRGDVIFSPGHVALAVDGATILHANAFHLAVAYEDLAEFKARLAKVGEAILKVRRPAA